MPQPVWRKIINEMRVPESPGTPWTLVLEFPNPNKLMKIEVVTDPNRNPPITGTWQPSGFVAPCSPDGDFAGTASATGPQRGAPLMTSVAVGALIARIGGSTAEQILTAPTTLGTTPGVAPLG